MAFTGTNIETRARTLIHDTDKVKWMDASGNFVEFINDGVQYIYDQHPESRIRDNGKLREYAAITELANTVDLPDPYILPMVEYLCYRFFASDAGDTRNQNRRDQHYATFLRFFAPV